MNVIFGSSGAVGGAVLSKLMSQGRPCIAVYHSRKPELPATHSLRVDLASGEGLRESLIGASAVFLATGDMLDQAAAEIRVIEAARAAGVRRVVKLSVLDAEHEAFMHARIHRRIEVELERSGMAFTHLRPGGYMQNFVRQYGESIRTENRVSLPVEDGVECPVDARDIGAVAAECMQSTNFEGRALNVSGPDILSYREMVSIVSRAVNRPIGFTPVSPDAFREMVGPYALSPAHVEGLIELYSYYATGRRPELSNVVREVTGHAPRSFEAFAIEHVSVWRR